MAGRSAWAGYALHGGIARALGQLHKVLNGNNTSMESYTTEARDIKSVYLNVIEMNTDGVRLLSRVCPGRIYTFVPGAVMLWRLAKGADIKKVHLSTYGVREGYLIQRILKPGGVGFYENGYEAINAGHL